MFDTFWFILVLFVLSVVVSPLILWAYKKLAYSVGILDRPHLYKTEQGRKPAPYSAGVIILGVLLLISPFVYFVGDFSDLFIKRFTIILAIGSLLTLVSFIDDMDTIGKSPIKIPPIFRLIMQMSVGVIIGLTSIKISYISNVFGGIIPLDEWYWNIALWEVYITVYFLPLLITAFWYVLIFNAVNFSDGVPGITGGFACISFFILGLLAIKLYMTDASIASQENSLFILTMIAIVLPTTFFLTRADIARDVIMGDSGTIMLGFLIATFAIIAGGKIATTVAVLGVYLIDAMYVVLVRLKNGQNPMKGDQTSHLHFRLLEIGLSKSQVRLVIYFLTLAFGLSAVFLSTNGKIILFIIIAGITVFLTEILSAVQVKPVKKSKKKGG